MCWAMDKPVEWIRMTGASPETDEAVIKRVLRKYGDVSDAKKGFSSGKKLPSCTKEEGEVWLPATGEISVCWKSGLIGHFGDKCFLDVSAIAASFTGLIVFQQPSWAHVVYRSQVALPVPLPPAAGVLSMPVAAGALAHARSSLRTLAPVEKPARLDGGNLEAVHEAVGMS